MDMSKAGVSLGSPRSKYQVKPTNFQNLVRVWPILPGKFIEIFLSVDATLNGKKASCA